MPIPVACKCGQKFAAKDELAGKAVRCPKCGSALKIPAARPAGDQQKKAAPKPAAGQLKQRAAAPAPATAPTAGGLGGLLDEAGLKEVPKHAGPKCPHCHQPLKQGALICIECGYNLETGRQMGSIKPVQQETKQLTQAERLLAQAEEEIKGTPISATGQKFGTGVEAYIFFFGLLIVSCIGGLLIYGYLKLAQEYANVPWFMIGTVAGVLLFVAWIDVLGGAFADQFKHGIAALLLPPYTVGYAMYRSANQTRPIIFGLLGSNLAVLSWLMAQESAAGATFLMIAMVCADIWFIAASRIVAMVFDSEEPTKQGLFCLLVPMYKYVFGFMRRDRYLLWTVVALVSGITAIVLLIVFFAQLASS